jgi:glycosyltransferase involved in cell wall biosynthesis
MIKKIGILTFWEFPDGMAPTTRILAYSKGLAMNGIDVEIFSFRRVFRHEVHQSNILKSGIINGVRYSYIHFFNNFSKRYKLLRIIDELLLRIKLFIKIYISQRQQPFNAFLFSFDDINSLRVYTRLFKAFSIPLFFVADEYPIPIRDFMKESVPLFMIKKYKKFHNSFKGRILMSQSLKDFYDKNISIKPTFILNTIVDTSRFDLDEPLNSCECQYICYMGNMSLKKDDLVTIIFAYEKIIKYFPTIELHLYGVPDENDKTQILSIINDKNLGNRIRLKGKASYESVPKILMNAKILVNAQPKTMRAQGGFPTKLGEYLLSKRPSVFTDSGDISLYIIANKHAIIVPPENPDLYAQKLLYILNNYNESLKMAAEGEIFVRNNFGVKEQSRLVIQFLKSY